jgi:pyruvate dehydrogenase E1 component
VVPILVDEARTFGMEGLFRQIGIYNPKGQQYTPVDRDQVMYYKEQADGQILQEGINEAGGMASWIAAATSYSTNNRIMMPFYVYYSMFGFQRIGDLAWAAGDMRRAASCWAAPRAHHAQRRRPAARGRPQPHPGRHHPQLRQLRPDLRARGGHHPAPRPAPHGREAGRRLLLHHPAERELPHAGPDGRHRGADPQGMYLCKAGAPASCAQLLGSGTILRESLEAQKLLATDWGVQPTCGAAPASTNWPATARTWRAGTCCTRRAAARALRHAQLQAHAGPVVASTDYMKNYAEQIRAFIPAGRSYKVLGTDGFGRSDFRALREHFEINRHYIVVAALKALADEAAAHGQGGEAIAKYGIRTDKINPLHA